MNKRKIFQILLTFIVSITIFILSYSPSAYALLTNTGSITIHVTATNTGNTISGVSFRLYCFASAYEVGNSVGYEYIVPYDDCKIDLNNLNDAYLPIHLTHFARTKNLPYSTEISDENGVAVFNDLAPGIYLIVPEGNIPDYFVPSPFIINIPIYNNEDKNWYFDINASPKMVIIESTESEGKTYISVKKEWKTNEEIPESIYVSLLCDFVEVEQVELNAANKWTYKWDDLSKNHSWSVVENNVPTDYSVSYDVSSNTVTIINTNEHYEENPEPSTTSDDEETTENRDELADTGQLNWPVPILSIAGLLLFSIGWAILNLNKKESV